MKFENALITLRNNINVVDRNLIVLLSERTQLSLDIARIKIIDDYPVKDIKREKILLNNLILLGKKYHLSENYIKNIFNIIIENSVLIQKKWINDNCEKPKTVASFSFLGSKGSYSHLAVQTFAKNKFNFFIEHSCKNFNDIIEQVEKNKSDYAILPIENSSSGFISEIYTILNNTKLKIIGEIHIPIHHCIIGYQSTQLFEIKKIYSHIQPFKQCSNFINHFQNWKLKTTTSTTEAIRKIILKKSNSIAAIASQENAKLHQLEIIVKNITNIRNNLTRFIILTKKNNISIFNTLPITTIMIIIKKDKNLIQQIKNLFIIHKVTIRELVPYYSSKESKTASVLIDIKEHIHNDQVIKILILLKKITKNIKILGCYPRDTLNF